MLRARVAAESWRLALSERRLPDRRLYVRAAYRALLGREPDPEGAARCLPQPRSEVRRRILASDEYLQRSLASRSLDALHRSRLELIRHRLPPAEVVVDLGGAANQSAAGALLLCGYPYRPRELYIVDLPDGVRMVGPGEPERGDHDAAVTHEGVSVRYLYQSMAARLPLPDSSADMVFSGESIEHITEADADVVCQEAFRVLRPGGQFWLDTPNAALTRLQSPDTLIHPEHKKEYLPAELTAKLERWGFEVVEAGGISPMPESLRTGRFSLEEMIDRTGLSENPDEGYLFFVAGRKVG